MITRKIIETGLLWSLVMLGLSSCDSDIDPLVTDDDVAYVNFYNAAEALTVNVSLRTDNMVYINDSVRTEIFSYPSFDAGKTDKRQYPEYFQPHSPVVPPGIGYDPVLWLPMQAGEYKFIYTSGAKEFLKDTTCLLNGKGAFHTFYLTESPEADNSYKIVVVPENPPLNTGRVNLRVVHLGTDAGELSFKRITAQGAEEQGLPQKVPFGTYSEHVAIDTAGVALTQNKIPIRVFRNNLNGEQEEVMTVLVPPVLNSTFTLLVQGFLNSTSRRIQTGRNLDNTPAYTRVTVPSNFRVHVRRLN